jgi:hypothetical protein
VNLIRISEAPHGQATIRFEQYCGRGFNQNFRPARYSIEKYKDNFHTRDDIEALNEAEPMNNEKQYSILTYNVRARDIILSELICETAVDSRPFYNHCLQLELPNSCTNI